MLPYLPSNWTRRFQFLGFLSVLALLNTSFYAGSPIQLEWEKSNSKTISTYERSNRYAYPLKINQKTFQRARNVELPNFGTVYITLPFSPYIDSDLRQSTVVDIFGAVIGFRNIADPSASSSRQITEFFVYDENAPSTDRWKKALSRSTQADTTTFAMVLSQPTGPTQPQGPYPSTRSSPRGKAGGTSNRPIEIGIDLTKGEWFFVPEKAGKRFKLAPTAKEKSIRIYDGDKPRIKPKSILISDTPPILSGTSNTQRVKIGN